IVQAPPDTLTQLFRSLLPSPTLPAAPAAPGQNPVQLGAAIIPGLTALPEEALNLASPGVNPAGANPPGATPSGANPAQAAQPSLPGQPVPNAPVALPLPPAPGATPPPKLGSTLQTEVQAKIETLFLASGGAAPALAAAAGAGQTPAQVPQNLAASLKLLAALPTGTEVKLRLIAISPGPGQPVVLPAASAGAPHVMAGRIIGYTPTGHAVLHSPLGAIVLHGNLAVPVGTELSFAIEPAIPVPAGAAGLAAPSLPQFLLTLSRGWPSLFEAIAAMRLGNATAGPNADPGAALAHLPQPGPKLAAGLVAAMQALRSGNIEALLGGIAAQRAGSAERDETVRKLRQEFGQMSSLAQDKGGADWRCFFIPLLDDGTVRQINLFYRRDRGKNRKDEETAKSGTRFIVEVDMSKMGPFQFDGLVREKRFDLMVRSHVALGPKMREDIGALFQEALAIGDYTGTLQFQKVKEFPVSPLEEIEKSATRVSA
ncbi:MAG TPA: hypothetical protein PLR41_06210, partial [Alphaproteobacteria bacterium]|nr:hypothetical protein [Alphaproteobacteria bacterium]